MVKDLAFVAYSVRDLAAATKFYRDVVGLEPGETLGDYWIEFNAGPATFAIVNGESMGFEPGKSTSAAFEVDDIHAMREKVLQGGAKVTEVQDFPNCSVCFVTDPEGNQFAFHKRGTQAS